MDKWLCSLPWTAIANDPNLTLVTHHAFDMDYVGATGKIHTLNNEFELIEQGNTKMYLVNTKGRYLCNLLISLFCKVVKLI